MKKRYDFIIVGGGSAGCVMASRLSEIASAKVLLIEAGAQDGHPFYKIPAGFAKMTKGIGSWGYYTVPQKHMNNMKIRFTQAKVLGGGSTVNAQVYTRGNRLDYDSWSENGCLGWSYNEVLPYFKKSEDNDIYCNDFHAQGGLLGVSQPISPLPICEAFFEAAHELNIPFNSDMNGQIQEGVGYYQLTQRDGFRSSSTAFLKQAKYRENLTIKTATAVTKIHVENNKAIGVDVLDNGEQQTIYADCEILLCSGSIGSPRLLMQSGIGDATHLEKVGVAVVYNQPEVGDNLQDHLDLFTISECQSINDTYDKYARFPWSAVAAAQYLCTKRGPAASSLFETGGFWYTDESLASPDIQFHLGLGSGIESGVEKMKGSGVTLNSAFLRPRSRGSVKLVSANPKDGILLDPNYWSDPYDRAQSIKGLKLAQEIMKQSSLKSFVKQEVLPSKSVKTDKDYFEFACQHAKTDHHPVGTCRMGSDDSAVVNTKLQFNGISGLRIIDASIMPTIVSSNTNAPTIMIAEKAADMVKADYLTSENL